MLTISAGKINVELELKNLFKAIERATDEVASEVKKSALGGVGARGPLPKPKDGGKPYNRTGQLVGSIAGIVRTSRIGLPYGVIRAFGDRDDSERRKHLGKERQAKKRAIFVASELASEAATGVMSAYRSLKTGKLKLGTVRAYAGTTNAAVAAILSLPPKDHNSQVGGRGVYRVFEKNNRYKQIARDRIADLVRVIAAVKQELQTRASQSGGNK